jgi:lactate permease
VQPSDVPVDLLRWGLAAVPIVVLLVLLALRGWKAPEAGPVGMFVAGGLALAAFRAPLDTVAVAAGKGVWDAVFILFVIWPALLLYRVIDGAGAFEALRKGVLRFSENELFLVLGFGWVFASFLQGITGFGTPIAVVAPLLIAIGVKPVYAVVIPLIGHAWANLFGTLAVAWLATQQVIDLDDVGRTAIESAALLWAPNLLAGATIAFVFGRWAAVRHAWPLLAIITTIHGGGQLVLAAWNPLLANFLASTAALLALYPLSHWRRYSEETDAIVDRPAIEAGGEHTEEEAEPEPVMSLAFAVVPYLVLTLVAVATLVVDPVERTLERVEVGLPFPEVQTGYDVVNEAESSYSAFAPLTHPGMFLLVAAVVAWALYRRSGRYEAWAREAEASGEEVQPIWSGMAGDAIPASVAIVTFLVLSQTMAHSGQTEVLALGIAEVAPPAVYAFAAGWIGLLGSFMTSSNASANIIFAPLQQTVADVEGLRESSVISAQHAGAAIGNSISPANVVLGTGAAGIIGQEGAVLRRVLPYAVSAAVLIGLGTLLLSP